MAKPDMPYGLFPWVVPSYPASSGALAVDLATAMKWYWRVRRWTATMTGSFNINVSLAETDFSGGGMGPFTGTSTINIAVAMSAVETFDVLTTDPTGGVTRDELSLCLSNEPPTYLGQYQWVYTGPTIIPCSGTITVSDSRGFAYAPGSLVFFPSHSGVARTMFCPTYSAPPNSDGWRHMTRDPTSGLYTPFLGDGVGPLPLGPLWLGGPWGQLAGTIGGSTNGGGFFGNVYIDIQSAASYPIASGGSPVTFDGNAEISSVSGSVDGQPFSATGFVEWAGLHGTEYSGIRQVTGVTYPGGGSISLTLTPALYWTYAPRIDPGNPTYDAITGAIVNNPATGAPWTIQEIISRHGP